MSVPKGKFWLVRSDHRLLVLNKACTHLDCMFDWNPHEGKFICPCHGSQFDKDGRLLSGPALRSLRRRPLAMAITVAALTALLALSFMGTHRYCLGLPPQPKPKTQKGYSLEASTDQMDPILKGLLAINPVANGARLYAHHCSRCHGMNAEGYIGRPLAKTWMVLRPDLMLKSILKQGVPGSPMPAWSQNAGGPLSAREIDEVVKRVMAFGEAKGASSTRLGRIAHRRRGKMFSGQAELNQHRRGDSHRTAAQSAWH